MTLDLITSTHTPETGVSTAAVGEVPGALRTAPQNLHWHPGA